MSRGEDKVRQAIAGADRAYAVIDGGKGKKPPAPPAGDDDEACPVRGIGQIDGTYVFLDRVGQKREMSARELGGRPGLLMLFGNDDTWLRKMFPKKADVPQLDADGKPKFDDNGEMLTQRKTVDFQINAAANFLGKLCFDAGLWGKHILVRRPGVWPHDAANVAVHCGDVVRVGTDWEDAGYRRGNVIWAAASAQPRPGIPCDNKAATRLQDDLQALWRFREPGGAAAAIGLLGNSYLGAAARWRPSGFFWGPGGCGKSSLLKALRFACPMHFYSNDATKGGIEGDINGIAMPIFIDEDQKKTDPKVAQAIFDMMLSASGGEGTQAVRGGPDGRGRRFEVVSSFMMAATSLPQLRDTHLGRVQIVELMKPETGADYREKHEELATRMQTLGPALWARALSSWERYNASLSVFREALRAANCGPREMDQYGAILAGWWILTEEAVPDSVGARKGILALAGLVRSADIVAEEGNARRLVRYLLSTAIQLDRSTEREPVANLIQVCLHAGSTPEELERNLGRDVAERIRHIGADRARRVLNAHGIRVIPRETEADKKMLNPVPRGGRGAGIWLGNSSRELAQIFDNGEWEGNGWQMGFRELPSAVLSKKTMKIGALPTRAVWVSAVDLEMEDAEREEGDDMKPPWE